MTVKNFLTDEQKKCLQEALKDDNSSYFRERVLMLLLKNDGKTYEQISSFIGCSIRTVAYWCTHGDPDNLDSLKDKRRLGKNRKATEVYIQILLDTVGTYPGELGHEFTQWTGERLASYLAERTGIELTSSQVRRILKQNQICLPLRKAKSRK
ncbi:MAG: helix-turn-helix domain-containing protein [Hydrococcus sp. SU_1_0]|nr:helix-turn-helix domain-containing protein [Hydrococcus sp. SU_1_0]